MKTNPTHTSGTSPTPEALRLAKLLLSLQTHMGPRRPSDPDDAFCWDGYTEASEELRRLFSDNQLLASFKYTQADLDAAVAKTRDACAQVCESRSRSLSRDDLHVAANEAKKCAGAIRARTTP